MEDQDFCFDLYVIQLLNTENDKNNNNTNENIIKKIIEANEKYCNNSEYNTNVLMETLTTYITGEIKKEENQKREQQKKAITEIENLLSITEHSDKVNQLFGIWIDLFKTYDISKKNNILKILLSNANSKSFNFTQLIWSFKEFRDLLQHFPIHSTGRKIVEKGIFCTMYSNISHNYHFDKSLNAVKDLLSDESLYPYLIKYIHKIIHSNESYLSTNFMDIIEQRNCSQVDFNFFILKFLHSLYKNYFHEKNKKELFSGLELKIKDYNIDGLDLAQQIYITMLYGMNVFLGSFYKLYDLNRTSSKHYIRIIKNETCKDWIQEIFLDYDQLHDNFNIENVYMDIIDYYDFVNAYKKKDNFVFTIKNQTYNVISELLGGKVKNTHIRYSSFTIIKRFAESVGFLVFPNFYDNLFEYINEVSPDDIAFLYLKDKIEHQHSLSMTLYHMTTECKEINEKSKYIFPETIYKIIDNSYSLFDRFDNDLYDRIKTSVYDLMQYIAYYEKIIELSTFSLLIYKTIYERKIINKTYKEIENKYLHFIGRLISNIKMKQGNKFQLDPKKIHNHNNLVQLCFNIISEKIDEKSESIIEIKDIILKYMPHINNDVINEETKKMIEEKINNDFTEEEIEYPDEFLDALICKPITCPVMIPNVNDQIFEKSSIVTQIYNQGINPYTREPLTVEILEKYNSEKEIKNQLDSFINKKNKWLKEYKESKKKE
jgi:U-box domain